MKRKRQKTEPIILMAGKPGSVLDISKEKKKNSDDNPATAPAVAIAAQAEITETKTTNKPLPQTRKKITNFALDAQPEPQEAVTKILDALTEMYENNASGCPKTMAMQGFKMTVLCITKDLFAAGATFGTLRTKLGM